MRLFCRSRFQAAFLLLPLLTLFPGQAHAWWDHGHEIVGQIAEGELTPGAKQKIKELLEYPLPAPGSLELSKSTQQLGSAAVWADYLKQPLFRSQSNQDPYGNKCHYLGLTIQVSEIQPLLSNSPALLTKVLNASKTRRNSISCTREFIRILGTSAPSSDIEAEKVKRAIALRYLLHIVGDIHQPLHGFSISTSRKDFRGNSGSSQLAINPMNVPSYASDLEQTTRTNVDNLHSLWDAGLGLFTQLPYLVLDDEADLKRIGTHPESEHIAVNAKELMEDLSYAQALTIETKPTLESWATESIQWGLRVAYSQLNLTGKKFPFYTNIDRESEYVLKGQTVVKGQLAVAGYRLGYLLNAIFDRKGALPPYILMIDEVLGTKAKTDTPN